VGDVLSSSILALSWPGDRCPRKRCAWSGPDCRVRRCLWYQSSDEAPACMEETVAMKERFCFVLVELYTCHSMSDTTKSIKFTICQVLTTYTEANSLQLVAYSMLHMRHQSFNPFIHDLFLYLLSNQVFYIKDAMRKRVNDLWNHRSAWSHHARPWVLGLGLKLCGIGLEFLVLVSSSVVLALSLKLCGIGLEFLVLVSSSVVLALSSWCWSQALWYWSRDLGHLTSLAIVTIIQEERQR